MTSEAERLADDGADWRRWGPYLSERAWGTVREDYSADGNAWESFPHDHARSRAYRWNEDGLAGISDDKGRLCCAIALWNHRDPILKERLFGLTNGQGNHGEDVKECYFYLDSTPSHSWMEMLYKYPQAAYPYEQLLTENGRRSRQDPEYELHDTGIFAENRYFDVFVAYAKAAPEDIVIQVRVVNHGPEAAPLTLLPTLWFRNTWDWGYDERQPSLAAVAAAQAPTISATHWQLGEFALECPGASELIFTENATNLARLYDVANPTPYVKDGFHRAIVDGQPDAVNPARCGTKAAAVYRLNLEPGATATLVLRFRRTDTIQPDAPLADAASVLAARQAEADAFYAARLAADAPADLRRIFRQAMAGMLWSKQFYHYVVEQWLRGDPGQPAPPAERLRGRNADWRHLYNERVMSMPDAWEYPWYAAWDLAFHCLPLALVDPAFAKSQLDLLTREWYQRPNGQLPAYEWAFDDVNPPVIAWAAWRVYKIEQKHYGTADRMFLERVFHKLMLYFTWWVNRKDAEGNNVFQGGFLGLDNIGIFDRSADLPTGGHIEQSDGTSWMGMFSLNLMKIALELARDNPVYEDIATKFFQHFLAIADALNNLGGDGIDLWNEDDEFFYDVLHLPDGREVPLKVRSLVGLVPLFAIETIEPDVLETVPGFKERLEWVLEHRPDLARLVSRWHEPGVGDRRLLGLVRGSRMKRLLRRALDPQEFLSPYGIRSLSKYHEQHPYALHIDGTDYVVRYEPAESRSGLFGGNSNWRGPIWFPLNYLLIESLQRFHHYFGADFKVECPTGSGAFLTLNEIANELSRRLIALFQADDTGHRPVFGPHDQFQRDPAWRDYIPFFEYFHGDSGAGLGASHQTGWTGLVAKLIQQQLSQHPLDD